MIRHSCHAVGLTRAACPSLRPLPRRHPSFLRYDPTRQQSRHPRERGGSPEPGKNRTTAALLSWAATEWRLHTQRSPVCDPVQESPETPALSRHVSLQTTGREQRILSTRLAENSQRSITEPLMFPNGNESDNEQQ